MRERWLLFTYGRRNLVGAAMALIGLGLLFGGVIKRDWPFIVAGLYALGYLLTPAERGVSGARQFDSDRIDEALDALVRSVRRRLPEDALEKVESIRGAIVALLPQIAQPTDIGQSHNVHVVRETALVYLPELLGNYLKLPAAFARLHPVKDGKTARQVLLEQLDLLDSQVKRIAVDLHQQDTAALLAHGRFLQEKFGEGGWKLD